MKHFWPLFFAFTFGTSACGPEAPDDDEPPVADAPDLADAYDVDDATDAGDIADVQDVTANDDGSASDDDDSASDDSPCPLDALMWSNPDSWPGGIPGDGDAVTIPSGTHIGLDTDTAALGGLAIEGVLTFCAQDLALQADWISVSGELRIGTEADPFINQAIITLTGVPDGETPTRGIMAVGGSLEFHGAPPATAWTKIKEHANTGDTALVLDAALDWSIDDQIVVAPTDFYGIAESELHQLTAVAGSEVQLDGAMQGFRWGVLQYATDAGISLTPDPSFEPPVPDDGTSQTPTVLDERAEVGNLTRNIVIQSIEDSYWLNEGFGAHVMIMTLDSTAHVDGVEFRRVGQAGELGRYPFHWHRLSYSEDGDLLGDATGHYLRNSTIHDSQNRCVTIHATNGVQVQNNICYDILGHAIYFEDGVERRNLVENNLVLGVRFPDQQNALKLHETGQQQGINTGASGLWASNPDNTIINNTFADAEGFGLWMAFQPEPGGDSANVAMLPNRLEFGNFDGNTMHSNQGRGVMFDNVEVDAAGNVEARAYFSTSDGLHDPTFQNLLTFTIRGWTLWKNSSGNFWNRTYGPTYEEFVSADGASKFFAGSGADGVITRCLLVGHSLNDLSPLPFDYVGPTAAFATYHSTFAIQDNIVMHFPHVEGLTSGAFASDDYYFRPVEKGHIQNLNNRLIDAHPGHRSDAAIREPLADAFALGFDFFVFAGAVWDPQGIWGAPETWNVYDRPFFTHNAACSVIAPSSQGAASCDGEYYGVDEFILDAGNRSYEDYMAISVDRLDGVDPSIVVDTWEVSEAQPDWILAHFRHFAARQNGMFLLDFPGVAVPVDVSVRMTNLEEASDSVVLGVRFSGTEAAQVYSSTYGDFYSNAHATSPSSTIKHDYTAVGSREEVVASMGETYWQDTANNTVWIKVASGDIQQAYVSDYDANNPVSEVNLYNEFRLRIW